MENRYKIQPFSCKIYFHTYEAEEFSIKLVWTREKNSDLFKIYSTHFDLWYEINGHSNGGNKVLIWLPQMQVKTCQLITMAVFLVWLVDACKFWPFWTFCSFLLRTVSILTKTLFKQLTSLSSNKNEQPDMIYNSKLHAHKIDEWKKHKRTRS